MAYYYLNNLYPTPYSVNPDAKSVPLRLTAEAGTENNNMPRSTVKQIYDHILSDLENISALNTEVNTYAGVTHATQAAANMLKMRVYMAMNEWDKAIAAGELVTGYSLPEDVTLIYKARISVRRASSLCRWLIPTSRIHSSRWQNIIMMVRSC